MADYKTMYIKLFRAITQVIDILQQAQIETEELYISDDEPDIKILAPKTEPAQNADKA